MTDYDANTVSLTFDTPTGVHVDVTVTSPPGGVAPTLTLSAAYDAANAALQALMPEEATTVSDDDPAAWGTPPATPDLEPLVIQDGQPLNAEVLGGRGVLTVPPGMTWHGWADGGDPPPQCGRTFLHAGHETDAGWCVGLDGSEHRDTPLPGQEHRTPGAHRA